MAVVFIPKNQKGEVQAAFVIGQASNGDVNGPMPTYGISTEGFRADNIPLSKKFNITVTGTVMATGSMTSAGARQADLITHMKTILGLELQLGTLEIISYGGTGTLTFTDARVVSVELPEQSEESGGNQYQEYSFTFEAYDASTTTSGDSADAPSENLQSIEETWESTREDQVQHKKNLAAGLQPVSPITITHTISATGHTNISTKMGYKYAKAWVDSRVQGTGLSPALYDPSSANGTQSTDTKVSVDGLTNRGTVRDPRNYVKSISQNLTAGTYSVTETWVLAVDPFMIDAELSIENNSEDDFSTVTLNVNIQGMWNSSPSEKFANAEDALSMVKTTASSYCNSESGVTLNAEAISESETRNEAAGTCSYSVSFTNETKENEDALTESLQITDNNQDGGNNIVAIIPVLAKADGPVIQDMATTNEKTRSVTYEITLKKDKRGTKPDGDEYVNPYKPSTTAKRQNKTETWNPKTGSYSLTVEWVYI
tara:strand:- start:64958 stop:66415 length:1458 start_codon:yes stop_codon:yes gene_type:complete